MKKSRVESTFNSFVLDQDGIDDKVELERKHLQATVAALKNEVVGRNTVVDETQQKLEAMRQELEAAKAELQKEASCREKVVELETQLEANVCELTKSVEYAKGLKEQLSSILWMAKPQPPTSPVKPSKPPGLNRPKSAKPVEAPKES